jgi:single-strand DNA-binding protein
MANFNSVMILGRLVRDPELKYSSSGVPVCDLTIATTRKFKKADGQEGESTLFLDVNAWRRLGEVCGEFLKKGREVFVSGELTQSRWVDEQGQKRNKIRLTADTVQFLREPRGNGGGDADSKLSGESSAKEQ